MIHSGRSHSPARQGFTLVELAVVLLAIGLLTGAAWAAGSKVWQNYRVSNTVAEVMKVTQSIREYYMNAQAITAGDVTALLDTR
ncbi:MAG: prepilin-type N-terminal cleavage/methylation domain-containing protein, partial [Pseudomonadota bacterium]|nr:prepilin-type N-terminal cleavage/methylation domain-containing protein [Pseudomonadota bacterium]